MLHQSDDSCIGFSSSGTPDNWAAEVEALEAAYAARQMEADEPAPVRVPWSDGQDDPTPPTPPAGALFPEIYRMSDDTLIVAIAEADTIQPDRHAAYIGETVGELMKRLDARRRATRNTRGRRAA